MLSVGDVAPEFYLENREGEIQGLPAILDRREFALIIFLRHLG